MCAGPVRTGGGAPTNEAGTTPYGRSTRPGCEYVPGRFAPGAVLLQTSLPTSCCRSTLRVRMRARPVRTGRSGDPAVLLQTDRAVGGLFGAGPGGGAAEHWGADEAAEFEYVVSFQGDAALVGFAAFRVVDAAVLPGFAIAAGLHVPEDAQAFQRAVAQGFVRIFFVALGLAFSIQGVGDPHQVAAELVAAG